MTYREWDTDARKALEGETIYLRERLLQRVEDAARESGQTRVTLDMVTQARRSRQARPQLQKDGNPAGQRPDTTPSWPVTFGAYHLTDPEGSVAICTLASDALMAELAPLAPAGVAIVGRVFTENFGVEKMVTNIVANPRVRTLILCGTESRHRVGQTLLALHADGYDSDGRVVGAESPLPIVRSLPEEAVAIFRDKLTVVDMRGEDSKDAILASALEAASASRDPWPDTWQPSVPTVYADSAEISARGRMAGRFTPDPSGLFLIGLGPWGNTIEMEHYTHEGRLDYRVVGSSAEGLCRTLVEHELVSDIRHALYLGREAQKAEMALRLRLPYEQDRPLNLPYTSVGWAGIAT